MSVVSAVAPHAPAPKSLDTAPELQFIVQRVFDAPRSLVWDTMTQADHLKKWWGCPGSTMPTAHMDLRVGGTFHYQMQFPGGGEMWGKWVFHELSAPQRLTMSVFFSDADGNTTKHPMMADWPAEVRGTTTFAEQDGKTVATLYALAHDPTPAEQAAFESGLDGFRQGCAATWDNLTAYLKTL